jgi:alkylated DNA repair dioxygenase AlkB
MTDITILKSFISKENAGICFASLYKNIKWTGARLTQSGKIIKIRRKMAYFSDNGETYNYAGLELEGNKWTNVLAYLRNLVSQKLNHAFNSVLLNLYEDGRDEIRWHSDKEPQLGDNPIIPCLNLGASRNFWFMEKETGIKTPYLCESGDLLIMGPNCQKNYLHAILKEKEITESRISLTFRYVYED